MIDWESLTDDEIIRHFSEITVWKARGKRAPHKPLLLLYALARIQRKEDRLVFFEEIEKPLKELLRAFGPPTDPRPYYPFWHLRTSDIWQLPDEKELETHQDSAGTVSRRVLLDMRATAGFDALLDRRLRTNPKLVCAITQVILDEHFPNSYHEDILNAVGMPWIQVTAINARDPGFRKRILRIYEHRCAICGWDARIQNTDLALEAAHIRWHKAGGPDSEDNGLALCSLHHRVFDYGGLCLDDDLRIRVSQDCYGGRETNEMLLRYAGQRIRGPQYGSPCPSPRFLEWHRTQVFRGPVRPTAHVS